MSQPTPCPFEWRPPRARSVTVGELVPLTIYECAGTRFMVLRSQGQQPLQAVYMTSRACLDRHPGDIATPHSNLVPDRIIRYPDGHAPTPPTLADALAEAAEYGEGWVPVVEWASQHWQLFPHRDSPGNTFLQPFSHNTPGNVIPLTAKLPLLGFIRWKGGAE